MSSFLEKIFGKRMAPEDWRLVKEIDVGYSLTVTIHDKNEVTKHEFTYYLYESSRGNRKFDVIDSRLGDLDLKKIGRIYMATTHEESDQKKLYAFIHGTEEYRKVVRPWLDGRHDPKIPRYSDIPKEEFRDALAGERK